MSRPEDVDGDLGLCEREVRLVRAERVLEVPKVGCMVVGLVVE